MSINQKKSHDKWVEYRDSQSKYLEVVVNGSLDNIKESDFEEYLDTGDHQMFTINISELSEKEFLELDQVVNGWFDIQDSLFVFHEQKISRFGRHD